MLSFSGLAVAKVSLSSCADTQRQLKLASTLDTLLARESMLAFNMALYAWDLGQVSKAFGCSGFDSCCFI